MVFVGVGSGEGGGKVGVDCEGHLEMHTDIHNTNFYAIECYIFDVWYSLALLSVTGHAYHGPPISKGQGMLVTPFSWQLASLRLLINDVECFQRKNFVVSFYGTAVLQ